MDFERKIPMLTLQELLGKYELKQLPKDHQDNIVILLEKMNKIRTAWNQSMIVTSGYRSMEDHLRIYKNKGITDPSKIPMKSKHLFGQAVDVSDPQRKLQEWCRTNVKILEDVELWMESFDATPNWCHFQILPPKSGNRFFIP